MTDLSLQNSWEARREPAVWSRSRIARFREVGYKPDPERSLSCSNVHWLQLPFYCGSHPQRLRMSPIEKSGVWIASAPIISFPAESFPSRTETRVSSRTATDASIACASMVSTLPKED